MSAVLETMLGQWVSGAFGIVLRQGMPGVFQGVAGALDAVLGPLQSILSLQSVLCALQSVSRAFQAVAGTFQEVSGPLQIVSVVGTCCLIVGPAWMTMPQALKCSYGAVPLEPGLVSQDGTFDISIVGG